MYRGGGSLDTAACDVSVVMVELAPATSGATRGVLLGDAWRLSHDRFILKALQKRIDPLDIDITA